MAPRKTPPLDRVKAKTIIPDDPTQCWIWTGTGSGLPRLAPRSRPGKLVRYVRQPQYPRFKHNGVQINPVRVLYADLHGLDVDNPPTLQPTCANRQCINPHHWQFEATAPTPRPPRAETQGLTPFQIFVLTGVEVTTDAIQHIAEVIPPVPLDIDVQAALTKLDPTELSPQFASYETKTMVTQDDIDTFLEQPR